MYSPNKAILTVEPEDFLLAAKAAHAVIKMCEEDRSIKWGDSKTVSYENGKMFQVKINKISVTVTELQGGADGA